jgi:hypothetical protein
MVKRTLKESKALKLKKKLKHGLLESYQKEIKDLLLQLKVIPYLRIIY